MRVPITLPEIGEPAVFSAWFVQVGDAVRAGERLAEVLIPGVVIDVLAPADGVIVEKSAKSREPCEVGTAIGLMER